MIIYVSSVIEFPKYLLNHILDYYSIRGINKFCFTVYGGKNAPAWKELKEASSNYNIQFDTNILEWTPYNDSEYKNIIRRTMNPEDFLLPADNDEFHWHPQYSTFTEMAEALKNENCDYIKTTLVDRIKLDGSIPHEILPNVPLFEQFPLSKNISGDIMKAYLVKMIMTRPYVEICPGHHILECHKKFKKLDVDAQTYHYKWFGDIREKETKKINMYKSLGLPWWEEQERLFNYLDTNNNSL